MFLVSLGIVAVVARHFVRGPRDLTLSEKLDWWDAHASEYNTLIIGTSRVYHGVIPSVVHEEASREGADIRVFNLGADGLRPPEDDYILDRALAAPGLRLRWVIVECNEIKLSGDWDHPTARDIGWHDWSRMRVLWRRVWTTAYDDRHCLWTRLVTHWNYLGQFFGHLKLWLWNSLRVGGAVTVGKISEDRINSVVGRDDGFGEQPPLEPLQGRALDDYLRMRSRLETKPAPGQWGDPASQKDLQRKRKRIERVGAKMVLLRPPYLDQQVFTPGPSLHDVPFYDYSNPKKFPALFSVTARRDYGHTNFLGSTVFSRMLADRLCLLPQ